MVVKGQLSYKGQEKIIEGTLLCDFYKLAHREAYVKGTEIISSLFIPRNNKYLKRAEKVVVFGIQYFVKKYLIDYFNNNFFARDKEAVVKEYKRYIKNTLYIENPETKHIEELHDLGYLPIKLSAIKEGLSVPYQVPVFAIENTDKRFFWLTNYLETLLSTELWLPITSATQAKTVRGIFNKYALETVGNTEAANFQAHDFSMRGMQSLEAGMVSGAGHLLANDGTDTITSIMLLEKYYNADVEKEHAGSSIPATEHSVMSSLTSPDGDRDEYEAFKYLITEVYPEGFVSIVSDTYDFWRVIGETLPRLKNEIMSRNGRVVIRPDSGNPVEILCGKHYEDLTYDKYTKSLEDAKDYFEDMIREDERAECGDGFCGEDEIDFEFKYEGRYYRVKYSVEYNRHDKRYYYIDDTRYKGMEEIFPSVSDLGLIESLWNTFGGTVSEQGYKVLDSHIGAIYGDSMTYDRVEEICKRLKAKGFASTNFVAGLGSYFYGGLVTRDSLGLAMKATYSEVNGEGRLLLKDPKTDSGKRSLKGRVFVYENEEGEIICKDNLYNKDIEELSKQYDNMLEVVFENGFIKREENFSEIRSRVRN